MRIALISLGMLLFAQAGGVFGQAVPGASQDPRAQAFLEVGIQQKMGAQLPLDMEIRTTAGKVMPLGELLNNKPAVLALVYYECPMLCGLVLNGLLDAMKQNTKLTCGQDYQVMALSFDHEETYVLADQNRSKFLDDYGRDKAVEGVHFLTCESQEQILALCETVGFGFKHDPKTDEFAHGSGLMLITPEGRVSRYLPGTRYPQREFHFGLVETSKGAIGSLSDKLFLLCYQFDPTTGKYTRAINNAVRYACLATVGILGGFLFVLFRKDVELHKDDEEKILKQTQDSKLK
ncbi:MAG: protein SCO1/2 [Kiritimatiellia bacterium]|jgi:protein SCO1/2